MTFETEYTCDREVTYKMADLQGRKVFKVFNQDFIVDERYNVTKELGQGAYGIVWYASSYSSLYSPSSHGVRLLAAPHSSREHPTSPSKNKKRMTG